MNPCRLLTRVRSKLTFLQTHCLYLVHGAETSLTYYLMQNDDRVVNFSDDAESMPFGRLDAEIHEQVGVADGQLSAFPDQGKSFAAASDAIVAKSSMPSPSTL